VQSRVTLRNSIRPRPLASEDDNFSIYHNSKLTYRSPGELVSHMGLTTRNRAVANLDRRTSSTQGVWPRIEELLTPCAVGWLEAGCSLLYCQSCHHICAMCYGGTVHEVNCSLAASQARSLMMKTSRDWVTTRHVLSSSLLVACTQAIRVLRKSVRRYCWKRPTRAPSAGSGSLQGAKCACHRCRMVGGIAKETDSRSKVYQV
jgi:hypothetical protein